MNSNLPHILILSTGGTIAGEAPNEFISSNYQAGALSITKLLDSLPAFQAYITYEEIANIDSVDMDFAIWKKLTEMILNSQADAFIITHGTDTLEESVFFLDLVLEISKPIVLTCAMRPNNAIGSDGIKNLCNALSLALYLHTHSLGGIQVVCNDYIYDSSIFKTHTHNLNAFSSRNPLGYILDGKVLSYTPPKPSPTFPIPSFLPQVDVLYTYAGITDFHSQCKGLVVIGSGAGGIPSRLLHKLKELQNNGTIIINATKPSFGYVIQSEFIPSFSLSPLKSRIFLALCLANNYNSKQIDKLIKFWS